MNGKQIEIMELSESSKLAQLKHAETIRKVEAQKRARLVQVPTSIEDVKLRLRELGHPTTLFGENPADRRERLKEVIGSLELDEEQLGRLQELLNNNIPLTAFTLIPSNTSSSAITTNKTQSSKEVFYTNANENLIVARKEISIYSFNKSKDRIIGTKRRRETFTAKEEDNQTVSNLYNLCEGIVLNSSQYADSRPLTCIRYSKCGNVIATGSLASHIKLWDVNNLNCTGLLRSHEERITSVEWNPMNGNNNSILLASTSADSTCKLYDCRNNMEGNIYENQQDNNNTSNNNGEKKDDVIESLLPIREFKGHKGIVADCAFHPNGRFIATAGHDYSWRLWDVETGQELILQDGHINECAELSFHPDGSLIMTTDWAGVALLWDIRSGQQIHYFQGHVKKITCSSFNPNGFQVATGSIDNLVRIWDLRKKKSTMVLPAHSNLISDLSYSSSGEVLLTSSFDASVKIWGTRDYRLLKTCLGHFGRVMASDCSPDDSSAKSIRFISAGYDRTLKIWAHKSQF